MLPMHFATFLEEQDCIIIILYTTCTVVTMLCMCTMSYVCTCVQYNYVHMYMGASTFCLSSSPSITVLVASSIV